MSEPSFPYCYHVLGVPAQASWREVRAAYRSLVRRWHPDHCDSDAAARAAAEEKTKEINAAYKTLAQYYRHHGALPRTPSPEDSTEVTHDEAPAQTASASPTEPKPTAEPPVVTPALQSGWRLLVATAAAGLLLAMWMMEPSQDRLVPDTQATSNPPASGSPPTANSVAAPAASETFGIGSRLGDVYAIQGVPSRVEPDIWHYGKSRVFFAKGSVVRWESDPGSPLKTETGVGPAESVPAQIVKGATMTNVRAIQGPPWRETQHEWVYGDSRIFFLDGVVTGWQESPNHPLKVRP